MEDRKTFDETMIPMHIGLTVGGTSEWAKENGIDLAEAYRKRFDVVRKVLNVQTNLRIPVVSFFILPMKYKRKENYNLLLDSIAEFLEQLHESRIVHERKMKISVLGKWYDLPSRIVEPIKRIIDETKDYDQYFVNLCINYDGHEEIVDACKLIARKIKAEKIDVDSINEDIVKEDIYSSFLLPMDLLIKTGKKKKTGGFMLWDSVNAVIYFSNVMWPEFDESELIRAIEYYIENK